MWPRWFNELSERKGKCRWGSPCVSQGRGRPGIRLGISRMTLLAHFPPLVSQLIYEMKLRNYVIWLVKLDKLQDCFDWQLNSKIMCYILLPVNWKKYQICFITMPWVIITYMKCWEWRHKYSLVWCIISNHIYWRQLNNGVTTGRLSSNMLQGRSYLLPTSHVTFITQI